MSVEAPTSADNAVVVKEFYVHDLVFKFDCHKRIVFGIVIGSYEASDADEYPTLRKGQLLVLWNNSSRKRLCRQSRVHLMSRCVVPGDIVRRLVDGKETQRGYCKDTKQVASVQVVGTNKIIEHVSNNRLFYVKQYDVGDAICLGDKFGRIQVLLFCCKIWVKLGL